MKRQKPKKPPATITDKFVLICLVILNLISLLLTYFVHQRLVAPDEDEGHNPTITLQSLQTKSLHPQRSGENSNSRVPYISDEQFHQTYSRYHGRLPQKFKQPHPKFCDLPDYFDFFRLPKSQRSRLFEDKIIYDTFFKPDVQSLKQHKTPQHGTYLELGAFDGKEESNTMFFDTCLGWDGLLIEAQTESYEKVIQNRPGAVKLSFSPTCLDNTITASLYNIPLSNNGMKDLAQSYTGKETVEVPCGPLTPVLIDVFGLNQTISFFSLDVEGAELLVLNTIDFSKVDIHVIMIEVQNSYCPNPMSCAQTHLIRKRMAEANYSLFAELVEASDVFTKHGTEAWRSGNSVQEENAKRQWILKRRKILKEKNEARGVVRRRLQPPHGGFSFRRRFSSWSSSSLQWHKGIACANPANRK
ncbi:hypothetical protein ACHAWO_000347 [Cyclotella atomus]|uniref:Methyltransferase FkbM domain-containing protein n=1 Tax=Cyclotella atomus TaxID=382360 RepID=A0ABD3N326_9STRA